MARPSVDISPILSAHSSNAYSLVQTASSSVPGTPIVADRPSSPEKKALQDSNTFLTALAAQERRVLELKEELRRAEANLEILKKQWAAHETTKKRNELRQVEPLRHINAPVPGTTVFASDPMMNYKREQERRKLKPLTTRQPQRTVFPGSRHTKTLSLLSPTTSLSGPVKSLDTIEPVKVRRGTTKGPAGSSRIPDLAKAPTGHSCAPSLDKPRPSGNGQDPILDAGKQLVGDFKEGFWTFFEDLRQATVGEEIDTVHGSATRRLTSDSISESVGKQLRLVGDNSTGKQLSTRRSSLRRDAKASMKHPSSAKPNSNADCNRYLDKSCSKPKNQHNLTIETQNSDSDGWDSWDSPPAKDLSHQSSMADHRADPLASPFTDQSSPCTSPR